MVEIIGAALNTTQNYNGNLIFNICFCVVLVLLVLTRMFLVLYRSNVSQFILLICAPYSLLEYPGSSLWWLWSKQLQTKSDLLLVPQKPHGIIIYFLPLIYFNTSSYIALFQLNTVIVQPVFSMVAWYLYGWIWLNERHIVVLTNSFGSDGDSKFVPCAVAGACLPLW